MRIASLERLQRLLTKLPGVGEKTALRYILKVLERDASLARDLGAELSALPDRIGACVRCGHLAEKAGGDLQLCAICNDTRRDPTILCVVARVPDVLAFERAGSFRGRYHVLGCLLSPLDGIGPHELGLDRILDVETLRPLALAATAALPEAAAAVHSGKAKALDALKGHMMRATRGRADPTVVDKLLRDTIAAQFGTP